MKNLILLILFISFLPVYSQNIWEETFYDVGVPKGIECPDTVNCYILGSLGEPYTLHKSSDQGKTWNLIYEEKKNLYWSNGISVPDTSNIYLIFDKGGFYNSDNGGASFSKIILDSVNSFEKVKMYNNNIGVLLDSYIIPNIYYIIMTKDGWKSYEKFNLDETKVRYSYKNPVFINDSILYSIVFDITKSPFYNYILYLNINTKEYELNFIDNIDEGIRDLCVINENLLFICGKSNTISGGSGHDAIYKSTDGGKNWRRVLDLSTTAAKHFYNNPFGLQSIDFKDSLMGIAVGQFGKIVYTYDGGESWIYENDLPPNLGGGESNPPTMIVRYAGSIPIIAAFNGYVHRLKNDNLAPKPEDIYTISGRVWESIKGQTGIPISLGYRVTMTDSNGYYKFNKLKKGSYKVRALNKYYDGVNQTYYYKPFDYKPLQYDIELTSDTSGFDFNAEDLRTFYTASGYIKDNDGAGLANITLKIKDSTAYTDSNGKFLFPKIESKRQYDLTPFSEDYTFSPLFHTINLITGDTTGLMFTATPTTSVWESTENSKFLITPNPAGDFITIQTSEVLETSEVYKVQIFDLLGIDVSPAGGGVSGADGGGFRIDISHLPAGVYYVKIGAQVEKFVKSY